jgi:phage gpG-like protein
MSKFNFDAVRKNIDQVKKDLPKLLANDAQNYFLDAFKKEAWDGEDWEQVQRRDPDTNAYKYPKNKGLSRRTKPILIQSGRLRREVSNLGANARVQYFSYNFKVTLRLNNNIVPYGKYHNYGTDKIPKRKFMGDSPALRRILRRRIDIYMSKIWHAKAA